MDIFERLPQEDVDLLNRYINNYGGSDEESSSMRPSEMKHFLRFWTENKAPLYQMFGEQFILKREVCFEKNEDDLEEEMDAAIRYGDPVVSGFRSAYDRLIDSLNLPSEERYSLRRFVRDTHMLVNNIYDGPSFTIPAKLTIDGHPLQVNANSKAVKMLGKICKSLGFTHTMWKCEHCGWHENEEAHDCRNCGHTDCMTKYDGYETFRRAHSLVLNQKMLRGNLCLSIHPMDYLTMSDNESGWDSCMHWMEDPGDYRLGTIEMMNSPYCIVAYVEAKNPMDIYCVGVWNNKRWRQLIMITPELMVGNKQYPYFNDYLQGTAMKWVRELANPTGVFGPYDDLTIQMQNSRYNTIGNRKVYINLWFDYMYNDIYDYRMAFIKSNFIDDNIEYNLSGPAVCTNCGEIILKDGDSDVEPSWTICRECCGMWKCSCCDNWHYGEPRYADDNDYPLCEYCYTVETTRCEVCGDRVRHTENVFIEILPNADAEYETYNWNFTIDVCHNCLTYDSKAFEELFGPIDYKTDMWGRERRFVRLSNITDEGLQRGDLGFGVREMLRLIRDTECLKTKLDLLQKNLY